jgi:hypothetical protein
LEYRKTSIIKERSEPKNLSAFPFWNSAATAAVHSKLQVLGLGRTFEAKKKRVEERGAPKNPDIGSLGWKSGALAPRNDQKKNFFPAAGTARAQRSEARKKQRAAEGGALQKPLQRTQPN